ncbi:MAG: FmdB family zinc ribbon protein [Armatimonadota bacterium]
MPTYGYKCTRCEDTFEIFQRITDEPFTECEKCKGELKKLLYPVGIVFKGSGFHINDYKSDNKAVSGQPESETASVETEKKPVEAKPSTDIKTAEPVKEPAKK